MPENGTEQLAFDCPNCGETTGFDTTDPDEVVNNIYECGGCGENVLMKRHIGTEAGRDE